MQVDLGNSLAPIATPGVTRDSLDRLDTHVAAAHHRIQTHRNNHDYGYTALDLPTTTDPDHIHTVTDQFTDPAAVLTVGIGGSALGAATITTALGHPIPHHTLDNIDPAHTTRLLDTLPLDDTVVHVVSKSGTTTETIANFLVTRDAMTSRGVDWTDQTIVTTGPNGPLHDLARNHDLPTLPAPDDLPGRYAALSPTGLVPAAIQGHDIHAILDAATTTADHLDDSLYETPAYAYAAITHALRQRGITINAMMPYAEHLEPFAEWFAQLWAESLGKDGTGQTPVRALGVTDQHSQLQLYRAGPRNTLVSFVRPRHRPDHPIPPPDHVDAAYLDGITLGELMDTEFLATEASLANAARPSVRIEIDRLDETGIGELLYTMQAACIMAGELTGVNAFNQPAVEWAKHATRTQLTEKPPINEYDIDRKTTLTITNSTTD